MSLELRNISKSFTDNGPTLHALVNVSFTVERGEFVTLIGPSGSGKSTICNLITGLIWPDQGQILLNGREISGKPGLVGYMPQRDLLLPWRTVIDNAIIGAEIAGESRESARRRARDLLTVFGLESFADNYPSALSGGMRQRAALLRTILTAREYVLLDEPFGALDALTRREMQNWLLGVWEKLHLTILFITHDVREAVLLGDRTIVLTARPGRVKLDQRINVPRPRDDSTAEFISLQSTLLRALRE